MGGGDEAARDHAVGGGAMTNPIYRSRVSIRKRGFENIVNWQIYVAMLRLRHRFRGDSGVYPQVEFVRRRNTRDWAGVERYMNHGLIGAEAFLNGRAT